MKPPIGVAMVGTGFGQKVHIPGFQAHPATQVTAIYHREIQKASTIAKAHDIPYAADSLTEILALPAVQAVSIATPPFLHFEMAQQVIQAGKHLLLEKPTALSAQEARTLHHLAQQKGVVANLDFEFRFVPEWQRLAELLAEGAVGQTRLIKIDWLAGSRANPQRAWNWYAQREKGGGALGSLGSHTFDYIAWLFGPIKRLSASLSTSITQRPDPKTGELKPVDADDTCNLMLELADGTPCQVCISSVAHRGRGHWVEVYGDRGTLVLGSDNPNDYIYGFQIWQAKVSEGKPGHLEIQPLPDRLAFTETFADGRQAAFLRVVDAWVKSILAGQAAEPTLTAGVYSQLLMDLTHQANDTQRWVTVPSLDSFLAAG